MVISVRRQKLSGHGSLTKAGKVRGNTPQIPKSRTSKSPTSRMRLKTNYRRYLMESYEMGLLSIKPSYKKYKFEPRSRQVRSGRRRR